MRLVLIAILGLFVAACSSTETGGSDASAGASQAGLTAGNGTGSSVGGGAGTEITAPPGTQEHLQQVTSADRVFFGYDQHTLTAEGRAQVAAWADWLSANPNARILVEGHCDERGTRDYNLALGARRSYAVEVELRARGIDGSRIETTTFGKERPAVPGSNEAAWAQNRRAVVVVTNGGTS